MRVVLLGDSHLARLRRELPRLGESVVNAAVGGATVLDLEAQADRVGLAPDDAVVVSIGTNDAATGNEVPVLDFRQTLARLVTTRRAARWILMAPPGVDESQLGGVERTNAAVDVYAAATVAVAEATSARLVDSHGLLAPLGSRAFATDGLHLSGEGYRALLPVLARAVGV